MAGRKRSTVPERTAKTEVVSEAPLPQTEWPPFSWKDIPPFVAVIGALAVALSVARQLGFFWVLDLKLLSLLSTDDVLRNSLATVPLAICGGALGIALSSVQPPVQRVRRFFLFEAEKPAALYLWVLIAVAVAWSLLSRYWASLVLVLSFFIYGATISWLQQKGKLGPVSSGVVYLVWLLALMFLLGANEAQLALLSQVSNYELSLTTGETQRVNLLKVTSDTLMVMQTPSEISVVPRAQVKLLKRLDVPAPHDAALIEAERNYLKTWWRELGALRHSE